MWHLIGVLLFARSPVTEEARETLGRAPSWAELSQSCSSSGHRGRDSTSLLQGIAATKQLQRPAGPDINTTLKMEAKVRTPPAEHHVLAASSPSRRPASLDVQVDATVVKVGRPDVRGPRAQGRPLFEERPPVRAAAEPLQRSAGADTRLVSQVDAKAGGRRWTVAAGSQQQLSAMLRTGKFYIELGPPWAWVLLLVCFVLFLLWFRQEKPEQLMPCTGPTTAVDSEGPHLCPELVVPEGDERTLLVPLATPSGSSKAITVCDLHGLPVCKAAFSAAKPSDRRMILSSVTGNAVLAFCRDAGVDQGTGLAIFDRSGRAFGTLRADGPRPADGYSVVLACGCWQLRFRGNPPNRDLNVTDDRGSWLAGTEAHGAARYSVRVGPHVDAGLMILAVLGIDLLLLTGSEDVVQ
uniref:Phospholipid scramblase n=1 Tax=Pyrodinium bahamense TaxID=73915 RepID=A0A7S0FTE0_9DINO|mmetsp:Transcript_46249/g.128652  ORF Transcript_46249/g.128652 Transcript_46249/m.128652 type:complete len:409 (+) Transcript_46249:114-1340(+)